MSHSKSLLSTLYGILFCVLIATALFLRVWHLDRLPPSMYWEELAIGYDAYSLLQTGKDHHGAAWPIVAFASFGDYKPTGYFYAVLPAVAVLGLNVWAVRLPSALAGVGIVLLVGLLTREIVKSLWKKDARPWQLLAMGLVVVSPWALQFSRGGWEVNLATFFIALGMWGAVRWLRLVEEGKESLWQRIVLPIMTTVSLVASMYTYHATRLLAPGLIFIILTAALYLMARRRRILSGALVIMVTFAILALPLLVAIFSPTVTQRFAETSVFSDGWAVDQSNSFRAATGNTLLSRLIFHRWWFLTAQFASNYLQHFSLDFLLLHGDTNWRHSTQMVGTLFPIEVLAVTVGIIVALKKKSLLIGLLIFWILGGIIPAGLTKAAPHALRILPTLPAVMTLAAIGMAEMWLWLQTRIKTLAKFHQLFVSVFVVVAFLGMYCAQFIVYWRFYTTIYPVLAASEWQDGYQEAMTAVGDYAQSHPGEPLFITREQGRPAMAYWFYNHIDPRRVQAANLTAKKDQGEFLEFENLHFVRSGDEAKDGLLAASPEEFERLRSRGRIVDNPLHSVRNIAGKLIWVIFQVK